MDKLLGLHEPVHVRGEHECGISEVGCATVPVEVGDEFLGWHSHKLGVEAGLKGEVGFVSQRSSGGGSAAPWELDLWPQDLELEEAILRS
jgi:hypothetical protein